MINLLLSIVVLFIVWGIGEFIFNMIKECHKNKSNDSENKEDVLIKEYYKKKEGGRS